MKHFARTFVADADSASWSSAVATACSFLGCVIATVFGMLNALGGSGDALACVVVAVACGFSFALHLNAR